MIQKIGLEGAREMYNSLGVPMPGMVEAMRTLKQASLVLLGAGYGAVHFGLVDVDALRVVAAGVNSLRSEDRSMILVTHYQRLLVLRDRFESSAVLCICVLT